MKYGNVGIGKLTEEEKDELLSKIITNCILYVGESYEDFSRPVIKLLVQKELVKYN